MRPLVVLVPAFPYENPNLELLIPALTQALGTPPVLAALDTLRLDACGVAATDQRGSVVPLDKAALVWVMGFGTRGNFLDKLQLLHLVERDVRFVNGCDALLYRHAKYAAADDVAPLRLPRTFASNDVDWLLDRIRSGGRWVVKPPAASFGRGVFFIDGDAAPARARLEHLTDYGRGQFCLLQERVESTRRERRVLIAGGTVIGSYARQAGPHGHGNLARGARPMRDDLPDDERLACEALAESLLRQSIGYAGVDLIYPYCLEVNVANPGGLATLVTLGLGDAPQRCANAITSLLGT